MTELLPCPFCGGEAIAWSEPDNVEGEYAYIIGCAKCDASIGFCETEAEAIKTWNTRAERTCEMVLTELSSGSAYHDVWLCSACGEQVERHTVMGKSEPPNYCPNCGARVEK